MSGQHLDYTSRILSLQSQMAEQGVDAVLLSVGSDLPYFTGYEAMPSERLTMFVVPVDDEPTLFIPALEAPRVAEPSFTVVPWQETDNPASLVAQRLPSDTRSAIGDQTCSVFLTALQGELPNATWVPASQLTGMIRMRKDPEEITSLRAAAHAVDRAVERIPAELRFEGNTELDISRALERLSLEEGHDVAAHAIVASGPNGASPHHEAGDREIGPGDLVVCDFGGRINGYFSDCSRTFVVGDATAKQTEVHGIVLEANRAGRDLVAPGVRCSEIDHAARSVVEEAGFGDYFIHRTGHGIGLDVHEHPYIVDGNDLPLEEGMTFSVEPGIYLPGELGVRVEDIVACGPKGVDSLNQSERGLVSVE